MEFRGQFVLQIQWVWTSDTRGVYNNIVYDNIVIVVLTMWKLTLTSMSLTFKQKQAKTHIKSEYWPQNQA